MASAPLPDETIAQLFYFAAASYLRFQRIASATPSPDQAHARELLAKIRCDASDDLWTMDDMSFTRQELDSLIADMNAINDDPEEPDLAAAPQTGRTIVFLAVASLWSKIDAISQASDYAEVVELATQVPGAEFDALLAQPGVAAWLEQVDASRASLDEIQPFESPFSPLLEELPRRQS